MSESIYEVHGIDTVVFEEENTIVTISHDGHVRAKDVIAYFKDKYGDEFVVELIEGSSGPFMLWFGMSEESYVMAKLGECL